MWKCWILMDTYSLKAQQSKSKTQDNSLSIRRAHPGELETNTSCAYFATLSFGVIRTRERFEKGSEADRERLNLLKKTEAIRMGNDKYDDEEISPVLIESGWNFPIVKPETSRYAITGHESQVLTVALPPGDHVVGEPGVMMYLSPGMSQSAEYSGCCERCCAGECCWAVNFSNNGTAEGYAALTPNFPTAKVVAVDLSSPDVGGVLVAQQGAFMASHGEVKIGISLDCNFVRCCCAGMGVVRQKVEGSGTAFLAATGTIVQKVLAEGEVIVADTNCVLAFAESCKLDLQQAGNLIGMLGGGEGIFNTTLTGPGLVIIQSMNDKVFLQALVADKMYRR